MLSDTPKQMRTTMACLGLLGGVLSAQAALTITIIEDKAQDHLRVVFSGSEIAPFTILDTGHAGMSILYSGANETLVFTNDSVSGTPTYYGFSSGGWNTSDRFPSSFDISLASVSGSAGFHYNGGGAGDLYLYSASEVQEGDLLTWDAVMTYNGGLDDLGLADGQFGSFTFTDGTGGTFVINWSTAVVPEPSMYALMLGLGVAGVALLRRRVSRG